MTLGYRTVGSGNEHVVVMHDWFCDCSSYDTILNYLDHKNFTYAFVDLRGYGRSKHILGGYSAKEATADVLGVTDALGWEHFHVVGHSMSGMVAQRIALDASRRVKCVVAITPTPASGNKAPDAAVSFMAGATTNNDDDARKVIGLMSGNRYNETFTDFKLSNWRSTSIPEARVGYLHMFNDTDFSEEAKGLKTPILILTGEFDFEQGRAAAMQDTMLKWYPNATLTVIKGSGHYPMQETPVFLATTIEQFLLKHSG
jgi:pimeloyl-ACP methyl ester carboxylesterase